MSREFICDCTFLIYFECRHLVVCSVKHSTRSTEWFYPLVEDKVHRYWLPRPSPRPPGLTGVQPDPNPDGHVGHVSHLEGAHGAQDVQRHVGDLRRVAVVVGDGHPRRHHVRVADGLHLGAERKG